MLLVTLAAAPAYRTTNDAAGRTIEFSRAEIVLTAAREMPARGWQVRDLPLGSVAQEAIDLGITPPQAWVRYRFDRSALDRQPLALTGTAVRETHAIYVNRRLVHRSDNDADDAVFGWNRPLLVPLPAELLRDGSNEIAFRITTSLTRSLDVGEISIGPEQTMRTLYNQRRFRDFIAPQIINGILAFLTVWYLMFWTTRRHDYNFAWAAAVGAIWWFRNLHNYVAAVWIDVDDFWALTTYSIFLVLAATYGFAANFLQVPNRRQVILTMFGGCAAAAALRYLLLRFGYDDVLAFMLTIPIIVVTLIVLARACRRNPTTPNLLMFGAVTAATLFAFHDLGLNKLAWTGASFDLQPYGSLLVFAAFGFAMVQNTLQALVAVEGANVRLERSIADVTASLQLSETARRQLEVASAVESERERMMREMHDGIGSSLITALAVAEKQHAPATTIATLKRSIADLRIAVDSLEPIDGDVVMLLASLRYRMERDLRDAGMAFVWKVAQSPRLAWLDAIGALHVLRIVQEAIGNVLTHAGARLIEVSCAAARHDDRDGVLIVIADDGCGFSDDGRRGRGLANMQARAEALNAAFRCDSRPGFGSRISIWLPLAEA